MKKIVARLVIALAICGAIYSVIDNIVLGLLKELYFDNGIIGVFIGLSAFILFVAVFTGLIWLVRWAIDNA